MVSPPASSELPHDQKNGHGTPVSRAVDSLALAMAEGRREAWNRIQSYLHMADREITQLKEENE